MLSSVFLFMLPLLTNGQRNNNGIEYFGTSNVRYQTTNSLHLPWRLKTQPIVTSPNTMTTPIDITTVVSNVFIANTSVVTPVDRTPTEISSLKSTHSSNPFQKQKPSSHFADLPCVRSLAQLHTSTKPPVITFQSEQGKVSPLKAKSNRKLPVSKKNPNTLKIKPLHTAISVQKQNCKHIVTSKIKVPQIPKHLPSVPVSSLTSIFNTTTQLDSESNITKGISISLIKSKITTGSHIPEAESEPKLQINYSSEKDLNSLPHFTMLPKGTLSTEGIPVISETVVKHKTDFASNEVNITKTETNSLKQIKMLPEFDWPKASIAARVTTSKPQFDAISHKTVQVISSFKSSLNETSQSSHSATLQTDAHAATIPFSATTNATQIPIALNLDDLQDRLSVKGVSLVSERLIKSKTDSVSNLMEAGFKPKLQIVYPTEEDLNSQTYSNNASAIASIYGSTVVTATSNQSQMGLESHIDNVIKNFESSSIDTSSHKIVKEIDYFNSTLNKTISSLDSTLQTEAYATIVPLSITVNATKLTTAMDHVASQDALSVKGTSVVSETFVTSKTDFASNILESESESKLLTEKDSNYQTLSDISRALAPHASIVTTVLSNQPQIYSGSHINDYILKRYESSSTDTVQNSLNTAQTAEHSATLSLLTATNTTQLAIPAESKALKDTLPTDSISLMSETVVKSKTNSTSHKPQVILKPQLDLTTKTDSLNQVELLHELDEQQTTNDATVMSASPQFDWASHEVINNFESSLNETGQNYLNATLQTKANDVNPPLSVATNANKILINLNQAVLQDNLSVNGISETLITPKANSVLNKLEAESEVISPIVYSTKKHLNSQTHLIMPSSPTSSHGSIVTTVTSNQTQVNSGFHIVDHVIKTFQSSSSDTSSNYLSRFQPAERTETLNAINTTQQTIPVDLKAPKDTIATDDKLVTSNIFEKSKTESASYKSLVKSNTQFDHYTKTEIKSQSQVELQPKFVEPQTTIVTTVTSTKPQLDSASHKIAQIINNFESSLNKTAQSSLSAALQTEAQATIVPLFITTNATKLSTALKQESSQNTSSVKGISVVSETFVKSMSDSASNIMEVESKPKPLILYPIEKDLSSTHLNIPSIITTVSSSQPQIDLRSPIFDHVIKMYESSSTDSSQNSLSNQQTAKQSAIISSSAGTNTTQLAISVDPKASKDTFSTNGIFVTSETVKKFKTDYTHYGPQVTSKPQLDYKTEISSLNQAELLPERIEPQASIISTGMSNKPQLDWASHEVEQITNDFESTLNETVHSSLSTTLQTEAQATIVPLSITTNATKLTTSINQQATPDSGSHIDSEVTNEFESSLINTSQKSLQASLQTEHETTMSLLARPNATQLPVKAEALHETQHLISVNDVSMTSDKNFNPKTHIGSYKLKANSTQNTKDIYHHSQVDDSLTTRPRVLIGTIENAPIKKHIDLNSYKTEQIIQSNKSQSSSNLTSQISRSPTQPHAVTIPVSTKVISKSRVSFSPLNGYGFKSNITHKIQTTSTKRKVSFKPKINYAHHNSAQVIKKSRSSHNTTSGNYLSTKLKVAEHTAPVPSIPLLAKANASQVSVSLTGVLITPETGTKSKIDSALYVLEPKSIQIPQLLQPMDIHSQSEVDIQSELVSPQKVIAATLTSNQSQIAFGSHIVEKYNKNIELSINKTSQGTLHITEQEVITPLLVTSNRNQLPIDVNLLAPQYSLSLKSTTDGSHVTPKSMQKLQMVYPLDSKVNSKVQQNIPSTLESTQSTIIATSSQPQIDTESHINGNIVTTVETTFTENSQKSQSASLQEAKPTTTTLSSAKAKTNQLPIPVDEKVIHGTLYADDISAISETIVKPKSDNDSYELKHALTLKPQFVNSTTIETTEQEEMLTKFGNPEASIFASLTFTKPQLDLVSHKTVQVTKKIESSLEETSQKSLNSTLQIETHAPTVPLLTAESATRLLTGSENRSNPKNDSDLYILQAGSKPILEVTYPTQTEFSSQKYLNITSALIHKQALIGVTVTHNQPQIDLESHIVDSFIKKFESSSTQNSSNTSLQTAEHTATKSISATTNTNQLPVSVDSNVLHNTHSVDSISMISDSIVQPKTIFTSYEMKPHSLSKAQLVNSVNTETHSQSQEDNVIQAPVGPPASITITPTITQPQIDSKSHFELISNSPAFVKLPQSIITKDNKSQKSAVFHKNAHVIKQLGSSLNKTSQKSVSTVFQTEAYAGTMPLSDTAKATDLPISSTYPKDALSQNGKSIESDVLYSSRSKAGSFQKSQIFSYPTETNLNSINSHTFRSRGNLKSHMKKQTIKGIESSVSKTSQTSVRTLQHTKSKTNSASYFLASESIQKPQLLHLTKTTLRSQSQGVILKPENPQSSIFSINNSTKPQLNSTFHKTVQVNRKFESSINESSDQTLSGTTNTTLLSYIIPAGSLDLQNSFTESEKSILSQTFGKSKTDISSYKLEQQSILKPQLVHATKTKEMHNIVSPQDSIVTTLISTKPEVDWASRKMEQTAKELESSQNDFQPAPHTTIIPLSETAIADHLLLEDKASKKFLSGKGISTKLETLVMPKTDSVSYILETEFIPKQQIVYPIETKSNVKKNFNSETVQDSFYVDEISKTLGKTKTDSVSYLVESKSEIKPQVHSIESELNSQTQRNIPSVFVNPQASITATIRSNKPIINKFGSSFNKTSQRSSSIALQRKQHAIRTPLSATSNVTLVNDPMRRPKTEMQSNKKYSRFHLNTTLHASEEFSYPRPLNSRLSISPENRHEFNSHLISKTGTLTIDQPPTVSDLTPDKSQINFVNHKSAQDIENFRSSINTTIGTFFNPILETTELTNTSSLHTTVYTPQQPTDIKPLISEDSLSVKGISMISETPIRHIYSTGTELNSQSQISLNLSEINTMHNFELTPQSEIKLSPQLGLTLSQHKQTMNFQELKPSIKTLTVENNNLVPPGIATKPSVTYDSRASTANIVELELNPVPSVLVQTIKNIQEYRNTTSLPKNVSADVSVIPLRNSVATIDPHLSVTIDSSPILDNSELHVKPVSDPAPYTAVYDYIRKSGSIANIQSESQSDAQQSSKSISILPKPGSSVSTLKRKSLPTVLKYIRVKVSPTALSSHLSKANKIQNSQFEQQSLPTSEYTITASEQHVTETSAGYKTWQLTFKCKERDGYHAVDNECNTYIQCKQYHATKHKCPDGFYFNSAAKLREDPCALRSTVKCNTGRKHKSKPAGKCKRQYGLFPTNDGDCSKYIMCNAGVATIMNCPAGLVFNSATESCDWLANVPQCNSHVFSDYECPNPPTDDFSLDADMIFKYKFGEHCKLYIACQRGYPRLLSCENGLAFDEVSQSCIKREFVQNCSNP